MDVKIKQLTQIRHTRQGARCSASRWISAALDSEAVGEVMVPCPNITQETLPAQAMHDLNEAQTRLLPVLDGQGRVIGVVDRRALRFAAATGSSFVDEASMSVAYTTSPETPLTVLIDKMLAIDLERVFVVDPEGHLLGTVSSVDVIRSVVRRRAA